MNRVIQERFKNIYFVSKNRTMTSPGRHNWESIPDHYLKNGNLKQLKLFFDIF